MDEEIFEEGDDPLGGLTPICTGFTLKKLKE